MGSWCAFGYSSGLFIQYLLLVSFLNCNILVWCGWTSTDDFYVRFGQLSYHFFEKEMQAHITFTRLCNTRVLQKVLSLGSDYFSATFYHTYFYYKPSKYSPFTETHFCNLFTQSRKADK